MKKLLSLLLVFSMAVSLAVPAGAAEDAAAATMRLESTEGTVTVKNASGLSVSLRDKMRLFDGYSVKTAAKSYAYISLDGDKTLKLDASSEATVSKSGKKLEVVLVSGSLFFNVVKPLENSETLNIRTSSMVAGIRGTSACVSIPSREVTEVTLLTGRLGVTGRDTHSGRMETVEMVAGERTVVAQVDAGTPQERLEIQKLPVQEAELPGFAAVEVAKDPELQSKIAAETELSVSKLIEDAEQRLAADETAAEQAAEAVREKLEEQEKEIPNVVQSSFGQTSGGGSSGGSSSPAVITKDLTDPTEAELLAALSSGANVINVKLTETDPAQPTNLPVLEITGPLTVPAGKTLNLQAGDLRTKGQTAVQGALIVSGGAGQASDGRLKAGLINEGEITGGGTIQVAGHCCFENLGAMNFSGSLTSNGTTYNRGEFVLSGATTLASGAYFANWSPDTGPGIVTVSGTMTMQSGAELNNYGDMTVSGALTVQSGAELDNAYGDMTVSGTVTVQSGGKLTNESTLTVTSTNSIHVHGTLENRGALNVGTAEAPGLVEVSGTGTLGLFTDYPSVEGVHGTVTISGGSTLRAAGESKLALGNDPVLLVRPGGSLTLPANTRYTLHKAAAGAAFVEMTADGNTYSYTNTDAADTEIEIRVSGYSVTFVCDPSVVAVSPSAYSMTKTDTGYTTATLVAPGSRFHFAMDIAEGYIYSMAGSNIIDIRKLTDGTYQIEAVNEDITVEMPTQAGHTVTIEGEGFLVDSSIMPGGPAPQVFHVPEGESFDFIMRRDADYEIVGVTCDGKTLTPDENWYYSLGVVTKDTTVQVATRRVLFPVRFGDGSLESGDAFGYIPDVEVSGTSGSYMAGPGDTVTVTVAREVDATGTGDIYDYRTMDFSNLKLYVNGEGPTGAAYYTPTPPAADDPNGQYTFTFHADDHIGGEPDALELTLEGVVWNFGVAYNDPMDPTIAQTSEPATGELLAKALNDPAVTSVTVSKWAETDGGIDRPVAVHDGQKLNFIAVVARIKDGGVLTVEDGSAVNCSNVDVDVQGGGRLEQTGGYINSQYYLTIYPGGAVDVSGGEFAIAKIRERTAETYPANVVFNWTGGTIKTMNPSSPTDFSEHITFVPASDNYTITEPDANGWRTWTLPGGGSEANTVDLTDPTLEELKAALASAKVVNLDHPNDGGIMGGIFSVGITEELEIPAGKTLNLKAGYLTVKKAISISGALQTASRTSLMLEGDGTASNSDNIVVNSGGALTVRGKLFLTGAGLKNSGTLTLRTSDSIWIRDGQTLSNAGNMIVDSDLTVFPNASLDNSGTLTVGSNGSLENDGTLTVPSGGTLTVNGGMLKNYSKLTLNRGESLSIIGGTLENYNTSTSEGTLEVRSGTLAVSSGDTLYIGNGSVGTPDYNENVKLVIGDGSTVTFDDGILTVASITKEETATGNPSFDWRGGTIKCKRGTDAGSPVGEGINLTLPSYRSASCSGPDASGWYTWTLTSGG